MHRRQQREWREQHTQAGDRPPSDALRSGGDVRVPEGTRDVQARRQRTDAKVPGVGLQAKVNRLLHQGDGAIDVDQRSHGMADRPVISVAHNDEWEGRDEDVQDNGLCSRRGGGSGVGRIDRWPGTAGTTQSPNMTFFVTSIGPGKGADLGGLEGADRQCQTLAQAAGAGGKTWHAYLSTQATGNDKGIDARDRIGHGPWQNFKSEVVAQSVDDLHSDNNKLSMQTSLTERGTMVAGVGYTPNYHDVLTGSQPDGRAFPPNEDRTCHNWTSSTQGVVMVGHIDRKGLRDDAASKSWNSSHPSRGPDGGCSQNDLRSTGGNGLLYCFAIE